MAPWIYSLVSVVAVSLISLVGVVFLSLDESRVRRVAYFFVSFAVGALLGDVFIHLIPQMFTNDIISVQRLSLYMLAGVVLFFVIEKLLRHRHNPLHPPHPGEGIVRPELAAINIIGDGIHNFIDGVLIGASYLASPMLGLSTTLAVLFHEIPQELGDFGVLIHSGFKVKKALLFNLMSGTTAIAGVIMILVVGDIGGSVVATMLLPVTAGGFIYIAAANLIPELQHEKSVKVSILQVIFVISGIAIMALLKWLG